MKAAIEFPIFLQVKNIIYTRTWYTNIPVIRWYPPNTSLRYDLYIIIIIEG